MQDDFQQDIKWGRTIGLIITGFGLVATLIGLAVDIPELLGRPAPTPTSAATAEATRATPIDADDPSAITPPPPSGRIVYTCFDGSSDNICLMDPADGQRQVLADSPLTDYYGILSPLGDEVVFSSNRNGSFDLYGITPDGGTLRQITEGAGAYASSVSPDGTMIAFAAGPAAGSQEIYIYDTNRGGIRQLTDMGGDTIDPNWSPDGERILFTSNTNGDAELFTVRPTGANVQRVPVGDVSGRADWSPDGEQIVYYAGTTGEEEIYLFTLAEETIQQLTVGGGNLSPSFSPDGQWIAYASRQDGDLEIVIMRRDGSDTQQLTINNRADYQPQWGP